MDVQPANGTVLNFDDDQQGQPAPLGTPVPSQQDDQQSQPVTPVQNPPVQASPQPPTPTFPTFTEGTVQPARAPTTEALPTQKHESVLTQVQEIPAVPELAPVPETQTAQQVAPQQPVVEPQPQVQVQPAQTIVAQSKVVDLRSNNEPLKRVADNADSLTTIADLDEQEFIEEVEKTHEHQ